MQKAKRIIQFISDIYFRMLDSSNIASKCILPPHVKKKKMSLFTIGYAVEKIFDVFWQNYRWKNNFFHSALYEKLTTFC